MLDDMCDQGIGLRRMALQPAPRIIALAGHGDLASELPLLWNLCADWARSGYSVAVLDAMIAESADNPGLEQLLEDVYRYAITDGGTSWVVHPAARGLQHLCGRGSNGQSALQQLSRLFHHHDVVVIFASTDFITACMPDCGIDPLLAVSANERSILTAYQSLKHILLNTGLQPTIIPVVDDSRSVSSHKMIKSLQDCAMTFLGHQLSTMTMRMPSPDRPATDETSSLAFRLMENAVPLDGTAMIASKTPRPGESDPFRRSH